MKKYFSLLLFGMLLIGCKTEKAESETEANNVSSDIIDVQPISHATAVISMSDYIIYLDPTGGASAFDNKPEADLVLITDIHQDHMSAETLQALDLGNTTIIAPQAVKDELPIALHDNILVMNNGEVIEHEDLTIRAIPMYNLREKAKHFHPQGRGNGYVVEDGNRRLYIAGDTEDTPEMRNLKDIDVALIPMNLPYTMTIDQAANAVAQFKPRKVYPYHYRGKNEMQDVEKFKELVKSKNKNIEVVLADWYPEQ